jgi:hypothetical protein
VASAAYLIFHTNNQQCIRNTGNTNNARRTSGNEKEFVCAPLPPRRRPIHIRKTLHISFVVGQLFHWLTGSSWLYSKFQSPSRQAHLEPTRPFSEIQIFGRYFLLQYQGTTPTSRLSTLIVQSRYSFGCPFTYGHLSTQFTGHSSTCAICDKNTLIEPVCNM